ncbi:MAG TPA: DDE-type integrase/transposase/recombinase, partial [Candidatus Dojkabacteria bacterium]|nr:DDE-type integrase/transposase/recombinase [Candidatus Dojkabacteria bacterium]
MNAYESYNKGYKYILCVIDVFSKYAWCVAMKNKDSETVLKAVKQIIEESKREPEKIWVDKGSEFYNKKFKDWANKNDIVIYSTYSESKSVVVERFIRSLKELIMPIFSEHNTREWINILPQVVKTYNNRYHKTIKMTPVEASDHKNATTVFLNLSKHKSSKKQKPKFQVGDEVRVSRIKDKFEKGYEFNFTYEVFTISKVLHTDPITYQLVDYHGDPIEGSFYTEELLKTKVPKHYEVEKVISTRMKGKKKLSLVKYFGWPAKFNEELEESQLHDIPTK